MRAILQQYRREISVIKRLCASEEETLILAVRAETLSMNKLRQAARVHTRYASAYLWQLKEGAA
jgi:hypothetical protein